MACALREEGFRARHVEKDHDACETLRAAGFDDVFEGSVERLDEWRPKVAATLLHGSPPCPVWSSVTHPSRRELAYDGWPSMRAIVEALRTPLVTVENVGESPSVLWEHDLRRMGYHVASWVLDAANYGAPQRRVRRWIVASLDGLAAFPPRRTGRVSSGSVRCARSARCLIHRASVSSTRGSADARRASRGASTSPRRP